MRKLPLVVIAAGLFATSAMATSIGMPYVTTGSTYSYLFDGGGGDTLDLIGQSGLLDLSTTATSMVTLFKGMYTTVSTPGQGERFFDLTYDLSLGGVTHTITQPVDWTITWGTDTFVAGRASSPVAFVTQYGEWDVIADAFTIDNGAREGTIPFTVQAEFIPRTTSVPEPGTFGVLSAALAGLVCLRRRPFARS